MEFKKMESEKTEKMTMKVTASDAFTKRRLKTINGLTYRQYRQLQAGQQIEIKKSVYDLEPNLYEVRNG